MWTHYRKVSAPGNKWDLFHAIARAVVHGGDWILIDAKLNDEYVTEWPDTAVAPELAGDDFVVVRPVAVHDVGGTDVLLVTVVGGPGDQITLNLIRGSAPADTVDSPAWDAVGHSALNLSSLSTAIEPAFGGEDHLVAVSDRALIWASLDGVGAADVTSDSVWVGYGDGLYPDWVFGEGLDPAPAACLTLQDIPEGTTWAAGQVLDAKLWRAGTLAHTPLLSPSIPRVPTGASYVQLSTSLTARMVIRDLYHTAANGYCHARLPDGRNAVQFGRLLLLTE